MVGLIDQTSVCGQIEASDEMNFHCGLLGDFPPVVIGIPNINTKVVSLIHPKLSFWHPRVLKGSRAKGIQDIGKKLLEIVGHQIKLDRKQSEDKRNADGG